MNSLVLELATTDTTFNRRASTRREKKGPCPDVNCRCRTDGFCVKWNGDDRWVWQCRGCWDAQAYIPEKGRKRGWGDAIDYLRHYHGMTFKEAKEYATAHECSNNTHLAIAKPAGNPETFQTRAKVYADNAVKRLLHFPDGRAVLDYLHMRGFQDETIKAVRLGSAEKNGAEFLIIPWFDESGTYSKVESRNITDNILSEQRYRSLPGSMNSSLYLGSCLRRKKVTVLTESALDALTVAQEAGDLVNSVAIAGKDARPDISWLGKLACMPAILVSLDNDEKSNPVAKEWCRMLENAYRYVPIGKDVNEMHVSNISVRSWVIGALQLISKQTAYEMPCCSVCGISIEYAEDFHFSADGTPYCNQHLPIARGA